MNVLLAATHSNSFTTCGLKGQGPGLVNVLWAERKTTIVYHLPGHVRAPTLAHCAEAGSVADGLMAAETGSAADG